MVCGSRRKLDKSAQRGLTREESHTSTPIYHMNHIWILKEEKQLSDRFFESVIGAEKTALKERFW